MTSLTGQLWQIIMACQERILLFTNSDHIMQQPLYYNPFREKDCQTLWTRTTFVRLYVALHSLHVLLLSLCSVSFRRHDRHIMCWHGRWNMDCDDRSWSHNTHETVGFFLMKFFEVSEVFGAGLLSLSPKPIKAQHSISGHNFLNSNKGSQFSVGLEAI